MDGETVTADKPAFVTKNGCRQNGERVRLHVEKAAAKAGVYRYGAEVPLCERSTPHCFRHWFTTTHLERGMSESIVEEIRGDTRRRSFEAYHHISNERLVAEFKKYSPVLEI